MVLSEQSLGEAPWSRFGVQTSSLGLSSGSATDLSGLGKSFAHSVGVNSLPW